MTSNYEIFKTKDLAVLNIFKSLIQKSIKKKNRKFNGDLSELHKFVEKKNINQIRLDAFNTLNNNLDWIKLLKNICLENLIKKIGPDIMVQTKLNLSIQMPNDETSVLEMHSDCWSADSPFQLNAWIPMTNAFSSNSMFIISGKESLKYFKKLSKFGKIIKNIKPKNRDFIKINYGEYIIFNPSQLHGNIKNKTNKTRVSLNIRFKSYFSPEPSLRNADRKFGTYYKNFNLTDNTKFGIEYIKTGLIT